MNPDLIPPDSDVWQLLLERKISPTEAADLFLMLDWWRMSRLERFVSMIGQWTGWFVP